MSSCSTKPAEGLLSDLRTFEFSGAKTIACLGGFFGNLPALHACLDDAANAGVDMIVCQGDILGPCGHSDETIALLRERCAVFVIGNIEQTAALGAARCACGYALDEDTDVANAGHAYSLLSLSEENRLWLGTHAELVVIETAGGRLLVCHGSPRRTNEFLYESTLDDAQLVRWLDEARADALVCNHSGLPWVRQLSKGRLAANSGYAGRPDHDGDPAVHYALVRLPAASRQVEIRAVGYDHEGWVRQLASEGVAPIFLTPLREGVWTFGVASLPPAERQRTTRLAA